MSIDNVSFLDVSFPKKVFREGLVAYLKNQKTPDKTFQIRNLTLLGARLQETILQYISIN